MREAVMIKKGKEIKWNMENYHYNVTQREIIMDSCA